MAKKTATPEDFGLNKAKFAKLKKLADDKRSDLPWHHAFGRLVDELVPERDYGKGTMDGLVELLGGKSNKIYRGALYAARDFSRTYSAQDLSKLDGLTFTQVCWLVNVKDARKRDWYLQQCQKHGWSSRQLAEKIHEAFGKQSSRMPFKSVKGIGPRASLLNIVRLRDATLQKYLPALEQNLERLGKRMKRKPDDALVELVGDACRAMDELHRAVRDARVKLRKIRTAGKARS